MGVAKEISFAVVQYLIRGRDDLLARGEGVVRAVLVRGQWLYMPSSVGRRCYVGWREGVPKTSRDRLISVSSMRIEPGYLTNATVTERYGVLAPESRASAFFSSSWIGGVQHGLSVSLFARDCPRRWRWIYCSWLFPRAVTCLRLHGESWHAVFSLSPPAPPRSWFLEQERAS